MSHRVRRCFATLALVFATHILTVEAGAVEHRQQFGQTQASGGATLSTLPGGGLTVSNIGSSGLDGVVIDVGRIRGSIGPVRWMAPESIRDRRYSVTIGGESESGFGHDLGASSIGSPSGGDDMDFNALATGVTQFSLTISDGGNPIYVAQQSAGANPLYHSSGPPTGCGAYLGGIDELQDATLDLDFTYATSTLFDIPGLPTGVVGDQVTLRVNFESDAMVALNTMEILVTEPQGVGELTILDLPSDIFGHVSGRLGQAEVVGIGSSGLDGVDQLRGSNLGSSGLDGVSVEIDPGDTSLRFVLGSMPPMVTGNKLFVGGLSWDTDDGSGTRLPQVDCIYDGTTFDVSTDLSVSGPPTSVELLLDDAVVATLAPAGTVQLDTNVQPPYQMGVQLLGTDTAVEMTWTTPVQYQDAVGTINCDQLRMTYSPEQGKPFYALNEVSLRGADLPGNELLVDGFSNIVAPTPNDAWLAATSQGIANSYIDKNGTLIVDNIGSSGLDGVSFSLPPNPDVQMEWASRSRKGRHFRGHVTVLKAFGTAPGGGGEIGSMRFAGGDAQTDISADLSPVAPGDLLYNFYDAGVLVGSLTAENASNAFTSDALPVAFEVSLSNADGKPRLFFGFPPDTNVDIPGSSKARPLTKADLVEVLSVGAIVTPFTDVTDLQFRSQQGNRELKVLYAGATVATAAPNPTPTAATFQLHPGFPNPFNPTARIAFEIFRSQHVSLSVYDIQGRFVRELFSGTRPAGRFESTWSGMDFAGQSVASGVYVFRLTGDGVSQSRKMTLVK